MRVAPVAALALLIVPAAAQEPRPLYKDPSRPIEERVRDLLSRMTLEEKVDQIKGGRPLEQGAVDPTGRFTDQNLEELLQQRRQLQRRRGQRDVGPAPPLDPSHGGRLAPGRP